MSAEQQRRSSDHRSINIEDMIAAEDDTKSRAMLIVLNSINLALLANAKTVSEISVKLETHLLSFNEHAQAEAAMLNKGRGIWKATSWILGVSQAVVIALSLGVFNRFTNIDNAITALQIADASISARITTIATAK